MSSRKRHHDSEDDEEGRITTDEEEGEIDDGHPHRRHKSKKSKKHKKDKKHKSKKRRRRSESDADDRATDKEGGSTPEIEAGEVLEISDDERSSKSNHHRRRSPLSRRGQSDSRSQSPMRAKLEKSLSPPPIKDNQRLKLQRSPSPDGADLPGPTGKGGGSAESLSIDETNKLRASLGLPPLKLDKKPKREEVNLKDDEDTGKEGTLIPNSDVRHKPAENLTQKSATEKMRERLMQRKLKRQQESKLLKVTTLGSADKEVDDTAKWLQRQKKKDKEKKAAEKRAKMLAELDDEFGVGNLVKEDNQKSSFYDSGNLTGLRVEHDASKFTDGKTVILTLKDADILDENAGDSLVNVNMIDDEKVEKNKDEIRKAKVGYNPYDQEEIDEETGELRRKNMLDKYDEEIDGEQKKSFTIGAAGSFSQDHERELNRAKIRQKLAHVESLATPALKVASDYYTEEEVKFKKPKKKKKKVKRKMLKADDLLGLEEEKIKREPLDGNKGALPMDVDDDDVKPFIDDEELAKIKVDEDDDLDLQLALQKARKIKQRKKFDEDRTAALMEANGLTLKHELNDDEAENSSTGAEFITTFSDDKSSNLITINETSEFCRNLGAIRSFEGSGLGDSLPKEIRDFEEQVTDPSRRRSRHGQKSKRYDSDDDDGFRQRQSDDEDDYSQDGDSNAAVILDEEPDLQSGVAAAIKLATNKGYWETEEKASKSSKLKHLEARNYTIEDKGSDDRHSRRNDRYAGGGGPTQSFQEKADYKPNVKLEYHDDSGRPLNRKEAFRHLSHKFHGKTSGKLKCEKRMKKVQEESLMKNMSSTDTPLQTTEKLRQRQREAATPYVILTGNKVQATDLRK